MPLDKPSDGHWLTTSSDAHQQTNKNTCSLMTAHVSLNHTNMWNVRLIVPARPWRGRVIMFRKFVFFCFASSSVKAAWPASRALVWFGHGVYVFGMPSDLINCFSLAAADEVWLCWGGSPRHPDPNFLGEGSGHASVHWLPKIGYWKSIHRLIITMNLLISGH